MASRARRESLELTRESRNRSFRKSKRFFGSENLSTTRNQRSKALDEYDKHPERALIKEKFQETKKLFQEIDLANQFLHKQRRFSSARVNRDASPVRCQEEEYIRRQNIFSFIRGSSNEVNEETNLASRSSSNFERKTSKRKSIKKLWKKIRNKNPKEKVEEKTQLRKKVYWNYSLPYKLVPGMPKEEPWEIPLSRKKIRWSTEPILCGETHLSEDYERAEPDVDPNVSQAIYELELRLEEMTKYFVTLEKDSSGFGLGIVAMGVDPEIERLGIYVKHVVEGGAAEKAGIKVADQIAEVNDINLVGVTHAFAVQTLRNTEEIVNLLIAREQVEEVEESELYQAVLG